MKSLILTSLLLSSASAAAVNKKVSYDGFKVFRVSAGDNLAAVEDTVTALGLDKWIDGAENTGHLDVVVAPKQLQAFEEAGLNSTVMHDDLGVSIAAQEQVSAFAAADITFFNSYHPYAEHVQFMRDLVAKYPNNAEIVTSGTTVQGRPITGIHIWGAGGKGTKKAVVFHSTVHAREWITTMVSQYTAYFMLSSYATDASVKAFVDKYDYYIFPVVNPDGFVYSQTTDRLWRKNRATNAGSSCIGTDVNRNWPYQWVGSGSSTNPCSESFRGPSQGSSPEVKGLYGYLNRLRDTTGIKMYIDWHAYSQLFMTPYGYSCTTVSAKNTELQSLARGFATAAQALYGTPFKTGPICNTIYPVNGDSVDYANDVSRAEYTFTAELRDTGTYGFVLPPNQIVPSVREAWAGTAYLLTNLR
ncbi:hypothetical protein W97_08575 [Coniosporium apollinis CBS 100218]|uniref:Peptidase M14 domain-containing protein n=1 Tax=Coniosporium apollinis (strain CBS 100218) TaxID=1168221 RepID=R7Z545_CONA1|nr:uncharacterized protein W97_08575 [Coniosporium apollinis CBS 100218]EON69315.1 hypothetical protein W97_08575 [Coniosporium apollinis CBS 100218]